MRFVTGLVGALVVGSLTSSGLASSFVSSDGNAVLAWQSDCVVVDFDQLPGMPTFAIGTPVSPASQLSTQYATCAGAIFSSGGGPAVTLDLQGTGQEGDAKSFPNVICGTALSGRTVVIDFAKPVHVAMVNGAGQPMIAEKFGAWNDPTGSIVRLDVFDVNGVLLESTQGSQGQFIGIEHEGIASATFTVVQFQTAGGFSLDDITIGRGTVPADLDGNGVVDGGDLGILLGAWGDCPETCCAADLNQDGVINGADLATVLGAWE
ncbi:MAG: hypothetical protein JNM94_05760 [Phycisphaerae bacterium]|nr:hypothetical protein [Phycisphaerae bacterium]